MKKSVGLILSLMLAAVTALTALAPAYAQSPVTITIATVNNGDMKVMQGFTDKFQAAYPNIKLNWVVLPENELRTRVTTDVTMIKPTCSSPLAMAYPIKVSFMQCHSTPSRA